MDWINSGTDAVQPPWADIAIRCATDYEARTGKAFDPHLIGLAAQNPIRVQGDVDRVAWGFARKAWSRMRNTCQRCGRPGLVRSGSGGLVAVRCSKCELALAFTMHLDEILKNADGYAGQEKVVWHEHELPPLIRAAVPSHCWCQTAVPAAGAVRYITASQLQGLAPRLTRIADLLRGGE